MNEQNNPILEVKNLRVSYHTYAGEVKAVRGVQFSLEKGQALAIVGESGCGKSTLSSLICALQKPDSGEIYFNPQEKTEPIEVANLDKKALSAYREKVKYIFQDPSRSLNPRMTIASILSSILHIFCDG